MQQMYIAGEGAHRVTHGSLGDGYDYGPHMGYGFATGEGRSPDTYNPDQYDRNTGPWRSVYPMALLEIAVSAELVDPELAVATRAIACS